VGWFRPVTLWPFRPRRLARATAKAQRVLVFELNAGQLVDDVRMHAAAGRPCGFIGGVSISESGLAYGALMDAPEIRRRILDDH